MPSVLVEVRRKYSHEQEIAIMEAVHLALRDAFKILPGDKNVRLLYMNRTGLHAPLRAENPTFTHISAWISLPVVLLMQKESCIRKLLTDLNPLAFLKIT